jgi:hypothetical protein
MHIVGISAAKVREQLFASPLESLDSFTFCVWDDRARAYLYLFYDHFNKYAMRDSGMQLDGIHVLAHLREGDLREGLDSCDAIERQLLEYPTEWRAFLGVAHEPVKGEYRMEPLLLRCRALAMVERLRALFTRAIAENKAVVCGSNAWYFPLRGISPGPGYYS